MDIRQLRFLTALDETQHFGKAAQQCNVTQPTLSMRINKLEKELGLALVKRNHRFEGFTPEGKRILAWAKNVLAAYNGLKAEAASCAGELVGQLRVGCVPLAGIDPMVFIDVLKNKFSALRFSLKTFSSDKVIEALNSNQLDIGLCYLDNVSSAHFHILPFQSSGMAVIYHPEHFHWTGKQVSWDALSSTPLGLLTAGMHFRQSVMLNMAGEGISNEPVIESDSVHHLLQAVNKGLCCTVVPKDMSLLGLNAALEVKAITNAKIISPLGLIMRKSQPSSPVAGACFETIQRYYDGAEVSHA
ncbi:LysR family transcriptional regulator [Aestuariibacter sp. A3R04]|nr:LysR family transcriptional regulator [Aestuariibacter sp. A3R04]